MRVDTGADATFAHMRMERHMHNKRKSNSVIQVAKDGVTMAMPTSVEGTLQAFALNTGHEGIGDRTPVAIEVITVPDLQQELLSVEEFYRDRGYNIFMMQPGHGWSGMQKGDHKIPFRYDYETGGFYMDYIYTCWRRAYTTARACSIAGT